MDIQELVKRQAVSKILLVVVIAVAVILVLGYFSSSCGCVSCDLVSGCSDCARSCASCGSCITDCICSG
ncbi:MAG: hypothetical protein E7546_01195 [Ruminococcaceae bacterium]|nr:hypothetical protein [Oscillospiraceae bacterium]